LQDQPYHRNGLDDYMEVKFSTFADLKKAMNVLAAHNIGYYIVEHQEVILRKDDLGILNESERKVVSYTLVWDNNSYYNGENTGIALTIDENEALGLNNCRRF